MKWALGIGVISLIISCVGALSDPSHFFRSYLFSYLFWIDFPLGSLSLLMIYHLTGGTWGASTRRILEASSKTIFWMALLFVPIILGMDKIYLWLDPVHRQDPKIAHKAAYLNAPSFCIRAVIYFSIWIILTHFLSHWSSGAEKTADIEVRAKVRSLSAGGLVAYVLSASFASFDWLMSLEPHWYSTIYGMVYCAGQGLSAFAFALIIFVKLAKQQNYLDLFPLKTRRDLGSLLLTMVMVWTYLSFMQYLVIWMGNLPEESTWFVHRTHGGWLVLAILLITLQFGLPFCALLFRSVKDHLSILESIAWITLSLRIIDRYWNVMPSFESSQTSPHWQDALTFFGVGGLWVAAFIRGFRIQPRFATNDVDWPIHEPNKVGADA